MITFSKENYDEEPMAHSSHEKFLNKKIEMYDEIALVVGKDMATGCFAKSFIDIDLDASTKINSTVDTEDNEFERRNKMQRSEVSSGPSLKSRSHRKRSREDGNSTYDKNSWAIWRVHICNRKKLCDEQVNTEDLYKEVMKNESFDEEFLGSVFYHLNSNNNLAKVFMIKSDNLPRKWIEKPRVMWILVFIFCC